ncbi:hypothetical protein H0H92_003662 [Tricholoma furcatifolium]|nr:hypothetical protein H0H92_003662 [Tricholoma furcatifolium]
MSALNTDEPAQDPPSAIDTQQLQPTQPPSEQSCIKRGLAASCAYPDPDADHQSHQTPGMPPANHLHDFAINTDTAPQPPVQTFAPAPPPLYATLQGTSTLSHQQYYDYNYAGASTSTFRPGKRPRNLTEEESAAIRNFTRGDFFIGNNAPVRIDTRLPVRLTLGEGDQVHFTIGESL